MQTFLPYSDFIDSAKCLDMKRLGKQRVEAWQLYLSLVNPDYGWKQHPASKMWRGYEKALLIYGLNICHEWKKRGYKDSLFDKFRNEIDTKYEGNIIYPGCIKYPHWLGNKEFHDSHKSNLIRKFPEYYGKLWLNIPDNLPYIWPIERS
jgi:hypothetical protein